ncbi:MAG: CRTAC1 family protein [Acidobacteriota bacterium]
MRGALCVLALVLITAPVVADGGVTFTDIALDPASGLDYERTASPSSAILDAIKQQPIFTFDDIAVSPLKSRGAPGVALADFDRDGDLDVYVTNGPGTANSLFLNQRVETGDVTFLDVGAQRGAGVVDQDSTGVCFGDIDNDGDEDLYVLGNAEPNRLLENQGNAVFVDITDVAGVGAGEYTSNSCSFGDIDNDGLLDVVIANSWNWLTPVGLFAPWVADEPNQLFRNLGGSVFADVSVSSGMQNNDGFPPPFAGFPGVTWAIAMVDLDLDGDADILMADDQGSVPQSNAPDGIDRGFFHLFENDGSGNFVDVTVAKGLNQPGGWMALDFGDLNCDGRLDFFASNFSDFTANSQTNGNSAVGVFPSRWYLANADGTYTAPPLGDLGTTPFGWGSGVFDYDADGDLDVIYHGGMDLIAFVDASNGGVVLQNQGCSATFVRDTAALDPAVDHRLRNVQGAAIGDLDGNGFDDVVSVSSFNTPAMAPLLPVPNNPGPMVFPDAGWVPTFVPAADPGTFMFSGIEFENGDLSVELNGGNDHRTIQIDAYGTAGLTSEGSVNRSGIGAVITVIPQGPEAPMATSRPVVGGSSYASQHSLTTTFGLGASYRAHVDILWPGGVKNRFYNFHGRVALPEIPCSYDSPDKYAYFRCVREALDELHDVGRIGAYARFRFFVNAIRAWYDAR